MAEHLKSKSTGGFNHPLGHPVVEAVYIPDPGRGPSIDCGGHRAALAVACVALLAAALPVLGQQALRKPEIRLSHI